MSGKIIVIGGATASGKTALAVETAQKLGTEIISFDSRQFYREIPIGTAAPTEEDMQGIPHHFIGHISVQQPLNAGEYGQQARLLIEQLSERYSTLVMVGGSGLYMEAALCRMDDTPPSDPAIRERWNRLYQEEGITALQKILQEKDPVYFNTVDIHNHVRLIRALEVTELTGKPFSAFRTGNMKQFIYDVELVIPEIPRHELYHRINNRVSQMIRNGLADEARKMLPFRDLTALRTVGYTELFDHFDGKTTLEEAVSLIRQHTRNYAKRQATWFRKYRK